MPQPPDVALAHYSDRQSLVTAGAEVAGQMWAEVNPDRIVESWTAQVPELTAVLSGAQLGAARQADPYLDEVAAWQELDPATASPIDPRAFAGTASDGRGLMSLLMSPAFSALQVIASGLGSMQGLSLGRQHLDTIARTQVADAGRLADGVALAARRGIDGYVRVVVGKTCSRCIALAGKHYKWNAGFKRHPHCDCIHLPSSIARSGRLIQNPHRLYESMTAKERQRAGWSLADQQAIADGADLAQITNAHRGVYTAGGRKFTTEGTTKRGFARSRLGKRARMTPEQIYAEAANRDEALRLLYDHGYLVNEPAVVARESFHLAAVGPGRATRISDIPVSDLVRPVLRKPRTLDALKNAAEAEMHRVSGRSIEFRFRPDWSVDTAREHIEGVLRGLERYPDVDLMTLMPAQRSAMSEQFYARASLIGTIQFSDTFATKAARAEYLSRLTRVGKDRGWFARGIENPVGITAHEFGHILDVATLDKAVHADVEQLVRRLAAEAGEDGGRFVALQISNRATEDTYELIGEAFADVLMRGAAASPLAQGIVDLLDAEYARRGKRLVREVAVEQTPDLSKLTVAKLKALAAERGIKVPSKALKADIVKLLEGGAPAKSKLAALEDLHAQRPVSSVDLAGGNVGSTSLLTYVDGQQAVLKRYVPNAGGEFVSFSGKRPKHLTDAEQLAARVMEAVGARAPATLRVSNDSVLQEYVRGRSGRQVVGHVDMKTENARVAEMARTDEGRLLGLADALMAHGDRNAGNWILDADGHLWAIDNGGAFGDSLAAAKNKWNEHFLGGPSWEQPISATNDMSPADMAKIRRRLEALRPEFAEAGRIAWFDQMMARQDAFEAAARGGRSRLESDVTAKLLEGGTAPAAPLAGAAKRAAARTRQAEIDRRGTVGDLLANMDELIAKKADRAVFLERLDYAATTGVDAATVAALRLVIDDKTKLRAAMTRVGTKNGLKPVGRAGQKVKFDEALHDAVGAPPAPGTQVLVVRRGTTLTLDGETIPLDRAKVTTAVTPAKKVAPVKKVAPAPEPSILTPEEQRFKAAMQAMARERKAAEALAPPPKPLPPPPPRKTLAQIHAEYEANGGLTAEERAWVDGMKAKVRERKAAEAAAKKAETKAPAKKAALAPKAAPVAKAPPAKKAAAPVAARKAAPKVDGGQGPARSGLPPGGRP